MPPELEHSAEEGSAFSMAMTTARAGFVLHRDKTGSFVSTHASVNHRRHLSFREDVSQGVTGLKKSMMIYIALPYTRETRLENTQDAAAGSSCLRHRW